MITVPLVWPVTRCRSLPALGVQVIALEGPLLSAMLPPLLLLTLGSPRNADGSEPADVMVVLPRRVLAQYTMVMEVVTYLSSNIHARGRWGL